jgi:esterase/lipase
MSIGVIIGIVIGGLLAAAIAAVAIMSNKLTSAKRIAEQNRQAAHTMADQVTKAAKTIERQQATAQKTEAINADQVQKIIDTTSGSDADNFNASLDILSDYAARSRDRN